jgi:deferrochelatase/peroxidase EfeB
MAAHHTGSRPAGALTISIGVGPAVFDRAPGLPRPMALRELPPFPGDALDPAYCGGDLVVQACASRNAVAEEAIRRLGAVAGLTARWTQAGYLRRDPRDSPRSRPRDPLGFKDGTHNPRRGRDLDRHVWAAPGERTWMAGGTYMVVRRIEIDGDAWRGLSTPEQEAVVGRHKQSGAPLGRRAEFDPFWLDDPRLARDAHVRLTAPSLNGGAMLLRRSYTYGEPAHPKGLVFIAYGRDPFRQFVPMQRKLAEHDALTRFVTHVGSAVFAIPPGAAGPAGFVGDGAFA